jgi:UPF0755 protein
MFKKKKTLVIFVLCSLFFVLGLAWFFWASSPACSDSCQNKIFIVKKGESLGEIAQNLEDERLVRSSLAFQFVAAKLGITRDIQAGDFRLNPKMSPEEIAQELTLGTLDRWITLIEGWRREEITEEIAAGLEGEESLFNQIEFLSLTGNLEGKLFPDTYLVPKDADAQRVVEMLTTNFEKKTSDLGSDRKTLILASIIEREAKFTEDRPIVAGILLNRLNIGMALQTDAAVQYAVGSECEVKRLRLPNGLTECEWWSKNLSKEDLKINSPYNTYLNIGLPPAPICNPGLASIKAALHPQETDYWFYLSDRQGKMHYAKTLEEHNQNIEKYLR